MKARFAASAALALAVGLGVSGCGLVVNQATTEIYSPGDGVSVNVGDLDLRNVLVITDEEAVDGNLVMTAINQGDDDVELVVEPVDGGEPLVIEIGAGETLVFGTQEEPPTLEGLGAEAGSLVELYFVTEGAEGIAEEIPVLDGSLEQYRDLAP